MAATTTVAVSRLTEGFVRGIRPGTRVIVTSRGKPIGEVMALAESEGTRSIAGLEGSLSRFAQPGRATDDELIEATVSQLDQESRRGLP